MMWKRLNLLAILFLLSACDGGESVADQSDATSSSKNQGAALRPAPPFSSLSTNDFFSCATKRGKLYCWGQLPNYLVSRPDTYLEPIEIENHTEVSNLKSMYNELCFLKAGDLYCSRDSSNPHSRIQKLTSFGDVLDYATEPTNTTPCVIRGFSLPGALYCQHYLVDWDGSHGVDPTEFLPVPGFENGVNSVAVGLGYDNDFENSICVTKSGDLYCWGSNHHGAAGNGTTIGRLTAPTLIRSGGITKVVKDANDTLTCIVQNGNQLNCFGTLSFSYTTPTLFHLFENAIDEVAINAGESLCARSGAEIQCWRTFMPRPQVTVAHAMNRPELSFKSISSLAVNSLGACLQSQSRLYCWGRNDLGQLGAGFKSPASNPVAEGVFRVLDPQ